jgi:hypothetical protein
VGEHAPFFPRKRTPKEVGMISPDLCIFTNMTNEVTHGGVLNRIHSQPTKLHISSQVPKLILGAIWGFFFTVPVLKKVGSQFWNPVLK